MRSIVVAAALGLLLSAPVLAESNLSTDEIIRALRPSNTTRGIRPITPPAEPQAAPAATPPAAATPGAPRPPSATPVATQAPPPRDQPSVNLVVTFATGSADLTPQATSALDALGRALANQELATFRFRIEGHTDTVGDRETNQALSERRAAAVVRYLVERHGIAPARLEAAGLGETTMAVPTRDGVAEPRNRRVQVVNLGT